MQKKKFFPFIVLVSVVVAMTFLSRDFLRIYNLLETLRYAIELGIMAVPMTMIITSGGIDLSVASILALTSIIMGKIWQITANICLSITLSTIFSGFLGLMNGLLITRLNIPPIVVTIATMAAYRGIAEGLGGGRGITGFPTKFQEFGQGSLFGLIPYATFVLVVVFFFGHFLLSQSKFGRSVVAIGYNETGAKFSGINVSKVKMILYTLSGLFSGLAGIIYSSRIGASKSNAFMGGELEVITSVVLGGTSISGGQGSVLGSLVGVLAITFLKNGMNLARIPHSVQSMFIGIILVLSVILSSGFPFKKIMKN